MINQFSFDLACYAMKHHSAGGISTDATIQTCWDSDRIDLGRVGICHPHNTYPSRPVYLLI